MGKKRWNKKEEEKRRGKGRERGVEEDGPYGENGQNEYILIIFSFSNIVSIVPYY